MERCFTFLTFPLIFKLFEDLHYCLDSKLGEKRKGRKGKEERERGREGKYSIVCIGRKWRGEKGILFSFQIFPLMERFGRLQIKEHYVWIINLQRKEREGRGGKGREGKGREMKGN